VNQPNVSRSPWWRLGLGAILLLGGIRNLLFPDPNIPNELKPTNLSQMVGFVAISVVFCLAGAGLLIIGVRLLWQRPRN
jgi:hypothetical protein